MLIHLLRRSRVLVCVSSSHLKSQRPHFLQQFRAFTISEADNADCQAPYIKTRETFEVKYTGSCFCGDIKFEIADDPVDASYCHCRDCQRLHGAPYQWAAIIHKDAVFFPEGTKGVTFFNSSEHSNEHKLPCKVLCSTCHSPLADEGRNMMLVFPVAIHFKGGQIPASFKATHHMFYGSRVEDVSGGVPKFLGKKGDRPCEEK